MPKTREEIKHAAVSRETWRNNRTGVMHFDPRNIRPLADHILIELESEPETRGLAIVVPDRARNTEIGTRVGRVLRVGPGRRVEVRNHTESWMLNPLRFKPTTLKPGDRVVIGHYSDWESWNCSADGHESQDANIVLCQENDCRVIITNETD